MPFQNKGLSFENGQLFQYLLEDEMKVLQRLVSGAQPMLSLRRNNRQLSGDRHQSRPQQCLQTRHLPERIRNDRSLRRNRKDAPFSKRMIPSTYCLSIWVSSQLTKRGGLTARNGLNQPGQLIFVENIYRYLSLPLFGFSS